MIEPYVIGITGGSGSGKTRFLNQLINTFTEGSITLISQDHYYKPIEQQPRDQRGVENFDTLDSFDLERFHAHVTDLINGKEVSIREYTFNNLDAVPEIINFRPAPVLIIEGLFICNHQPIYELLKLKIFIDTKPHLSMKRRILRDQKERGYDLDDVMYRFEHHVMPAYEQHIEPFREHSDIVIPNNQDFEQALDVIASFLKQKAGIEFDSK